MTPPVLLDTPRLRLRPPSLDDAGELFTEYTQDPEVTRYMTWLPHKTEVETCAFLRRCVMALEQRTAVPWVIERRTDHRLLGVIELRPEGHRASLGYVLGRAHWGQGLMTEAARAVMDWAFEVPDIYRVWAVTDVDNVASARVLEKVGMTREGLLRRWIMHPNVSSEPRDCWCYARVR